MLEKLSTNDLQTLDALLEKLISEPYSVSRIMANVRDISKLFNQESRTYDLLTGEINGYGYCVQNMQGFGIAYFTVEHIAINFAKWCERNVDWEYLEYLMQYKIQDDPYKQWFYDKREHACNQGGVF